jgi:hypothetical protein
MLQLLTMLQHIRAIIHLIVPASAAPVSTIHFFMMLLMNVVIGFLQFHIVRIVVRWHLWRLLLLLLRMSR